MIAFHQFSPILPSRFFSAAAFDPHHFLLRCTSTMSRPGKRNKLATRFGGKPGRHVTCKAAQGDFHFCYRHLGPIPPMTVESGAHHSTGRCSHASPGSLRTPLLSALPWSLPRLLVPAPAACLLVPSGPGPPLHQEENVTSILR